MPATCQTESAFKLRRGWRLAAVAMLGLWLLIAAVAVAAQTAGEVPLIIGKRTIHVFRAPLGAFTAAERAEGARQRIARALETEGAGWTSVKTTDQDVLVLLDGKPMFTVASADARKLSDESAQDLANAASRVLQTVWREAREARNPQLTVMAAAKVAAAALLLALLLTVIFKFTRSIRFAVAARLTQRREMLAETGLQSKISSQLLGIASRAGVVVAWLLSLLVIFVVVTYSLRQFVVTRPVGEALTGTLASLLVQVLQSVAGAVPGMIVAAVIFLMAWVATQVSSEIFNHIATGQLKLGVLDTHTAAASRRIANASIWLFALAMAYPYLPGSHTDAFKGLSVMLGLMVSIGASGLFGQVASGLMLVYTRALSVGEYVRIQDSEGTVTELGLLVTRLRTGNGEVVSLPNALVLGNVTRNYSRAAHGRGFVLDTTITIGYDTPWRQVHALLLEAARSLPDIADDPPPYVVQTALSDFYVAYKLVVYARAEMPAVRDRLTSNLHAAIQDAFNRHGVQIMSPHYENDPEEPKRVAEPGWYAAPAVPLPEPKA